MSQRQRPWYFHDHFEDGSSSDEEEARLERIAFLLECHRRRNIPQQRIPHAPWIPIPEPVFLRAPRIPHAPWRAYPLFSEEDAQYIAIGMARGFRLFFICADVHAMRQLAQTCPMWLAAFRLSCHILQNPPGLSIPRAAS